MGVASSGTVTDVASGALFVRASLNPKRHVPPSLETPTATTRKNAMATTISTVLTGTPLRDYNRNAPEGSAILTRTRVTSMHRVPGRRPTSSRSPTSAYSTEAHVVSRYVDLVRCQDRIGRNELPESCFAIAVLGEARPRRLCAGRIAEDVGPSAAVLACGVRGLGEPPPSRGRRVPPEGEPRPS